MESVIAGVVIALVGALVTFGLHRLERHLEKQDQDAALREKAATEREKKIDETLARYGNDITDIVRRLKMRRRADGSLR